MTKPVTIPNTFATATTAIPLSQLDSDFSTVATALNDANTYSNYAADTGVVNAYVVTLTGVSTTYSAGLRIQFKAGNANTGASTLNVNGGGTKNITFQDASALSSGTIAANAIVDVMYDGTQFLLMNDPAGTVGTGDVVGPAGATANAIVRFDSTTGKLVKNSVVTIADSTGDVAGVGALTATGNVSFDGGTFVFNESGADKDFRIEGDTDANLFFTDASTDRVGIGTSSPARKLQVNSGEAVAARFTRGGGIVANNSLEWFDGTNGWYAGVSGSNFWGVAYNSSGAIDTAAIRLDSSGNLGLGVTPSAWWSNTKALQIGQGGAFESRTGSNLIQMMANTFINTSGSYTYITTDAASRYNQTAGQHQWYTAPSGTANTAITFTQAMTLDASGNLGVGTSSPSTYAKLTLAKSGADAALALDKTGVGFTAYLATDGVNAWIGSGSGSTGKKFFVSLTAPDSAATLDSSGNLGIGTTSWPSGQRLRVAGGDVGFEGQYFYLLNANASVQLGAGQNAKIENTDSTNTLAISRTGASSIITLSTAGTERARIDSSGNLLVGSTSTSGSSSNTKQILGGNFRTFFNGPITVGASATATILTLSSSVTGVYIVNANFGAQGNEIYGGMAIIVANAGSFRIVTNGGGTRSAISLSGANVQITNALGSPLDATATAIFIGN